MSHQTNGLPWSRGRGFRPKGPFQPARRPGSTNGSGDSSDSSSSSTSRPSNNSVSQVTSAMANTKLTNNSHGNNSGYRSNSGSNAAAGDGSRQSGGNLSNGYQNNKHGSSSQGSSGGVSKDIRFAGNNAASSSSAGFGGSSGKPQNQVQYKQQNSTGNSSPGPSKDSSSKKNDAKVIAKYNYKANPDSPLGKPELSLKQGQTLTLIGKHPDNDQWWHVGNRDDRSHGYAPASYLKLLDTKPSALPWLESKKSEELPEAKPVFKAYQSAYNRPISEEPAEEEKGPSNNNRYYCEVCDKQLNGPKPYGAHMTSKAHKEEYENAKAYGRV